MEEKPTTLTPRTCEDIKTCVSRIAWTAAAKGALQGLCGSTSTHPLRDYFVEIIDLLAARQRTLTDRCHRLLDGEPDGGGIVQ